MKPIESYADKKHCELCGALVVQRDVDPLPDYEATEVIRELAFRACDSPFLVTLLLQRIAGLTEREIAAKLKITRQAVHSRIVRAEKIMLATQVQ